MCLSSKDPLESMVTVYSNLAHTQQSALALNYEQESYHEQSLALVLEMTRVQTFGLLRIAPKNDSQSGLVECASIYEHADLSFEIPA